jgi:type II secretory pathway component PulC
VAGKEFVAEVSVDKMVTPSSGYRMPIFRRSRSSGLVLFNRVLAGVVLVLLVAVVYSIASIKTDVTSAGGQLESGVIAQPVVAAMIINEPLPSVDVYLEKLKDRNVFLPNDAVVTTSAVAVLTGKVADLKLLGVSIDSAADEESMAIIKNKAESRTYFVKKGQMVGDTGYSLERVLSDRAILKKGKQEIELK